jgi:phosphatidylethanolamine-binding protein (PEBP) family uncharacterized protein
MRRLRGTTTTSLPLALALALALAGCGGSGTAATIKPLVVPFRSSAIHGGQIPAAYTCDGKDISPPVTWGAIPTSIEELALFALEITPAAQQRATITVEWAMTGIKPSLHHLSAGQTPAGAYVLKASNGHRHYSICPPKGQTKLYQFALYALPAGVHASREIGGLELLTNLNKTSPEYKAPAYGAFRASYTRK